MGQSFSGDKPDKPEILKSVELIMRKRLECKKSKLYIDALNDECIPIVCAVDRFEDIIYIKDLKDLKDILKGEIASIIKRHLRNPGGFDGLIKLLVEMLETVTQPGKKCEGLEERQTHVVHANKSFIRIDYYLYIQSDDGKEAALFYFVQVGLIEVAKTRLPVLIYELTRATEDENLERESEELSRVGDLKISSVNDAVEYLRSRAAN